MDHDGSNLSKSSHELMLAHTPVGLGLFDAGDFRLLDMNDAYCRILDRCLEPHWKQGRIIGFAFTDWLPGVQNTSLVSIFQTVVETGIPFRNGEFAFSTAGQDFTYWNWSLDPIFDGDHQVTYLQHSMLDITTQVRMRLKAEERERAIQESSLLNENERRRLTVVETVARSVRVSLDVEYVGRAAVQSIMEHFSPLRVSIHVADPVRRMLKLLSRAGSSNDEAAFLQLQQVPYESPLLLTQARHRREPLVIEDEQIAPVNTILESTLTTTRHLVRGYVCIPLWFHDYFEGALTAVFTTPIAASGVEVKMLADCGVYIAFALAHARMHAEVEHERTRFHRILDQMPEGIVLFDAPTLCIQYANEVAAHILGVPLQTLIGKDIAWLAELTHVNDAQRRPLAPISYPAVHALRGETLMNREGIITRPDGSTVTTLSSIAPLRAADGRVLSVISVFQDITDRKTVEQQKTAFLSIASHELRTPITSIQAYAEILQGLLRSGQSLDQPRIKRATGVMIEQSRRLTRLVEEMLELSRIEMSQLSLRLVPYDLVAALAQLIDEQALVAPKHHLRLVFKGISETEQLIGLFDADRMEQIVHNLLSNAVKYSAMNSQIEIGLHYMSEEREEVLLWVKDYGIGIDEAELPRIFDRFHRVRSIDPSISGFGIGLFLVKEFVRRHGGRVWAESRKGQGSTFFVLLPLHRAM